MRVVNCARGVRRAFVSTVGHLRGSKVCLVVGMLLAIRGPMVYAAGGAPSVRVTSPQMNADLDEGSTLVLTAAASGSAIAKVEFYDGDKLVGTATQAPFQVTYHPDSLPAGNYCITARATNAAGQAATSSPVTCTAKRKMDRQYKSYDYEERAEQMLKQVRLTIPEGVTTVRGILVVTNPSGGDTRDSYTETAYGEFLYLHDFAFLGAKSFTSHVENIPVLTNALQQFAQNTKHPELLNVPFATTGFSAGGGFASRLLVEVPERVIASVPVCSRLNLDKPDISLVTPGCVISGEKETMDAVVEPVLEAYRPQGAMFSWMTVQGGGHGRMGQEVLAMPFLDTAVRLRYAAEEDPRKGPVHLKALKPAEGWGADNTTWKQGLTSIAPADKFKGDVRKSSWLPTEDLAFIYRAYATYDNPLTIVSPPPHWKTRAWDPGSNVTIVVDDSKFPQWKKLEFYDGAKKLGEITQGSAQFTALNLGTGLHVMSVLGTGGQGVVRSSNPVLVIVRKLPTEDGGAKGADTPSASR